MDWGHEVALLYDKEWNEQGTEEEDERCCWAVVDRRSIGRHNHVPVSRLLYGGVLVRHIILWLPTATS